MPESGVIRPCFDASEAVRLAPLRDKHGRWLKGQSGNRGGRPRRLPKDIRLAMARDWPSMYENLLDLAFNASDDRVRLEATREFFNRFHGKPTEMLEPNAESIETSDDDKLIDDAAYMTAEGIIDAEERSTATAERRARAEMIAERQTLTCIETRGAQGAIECGERDVVDVSAVILERARMGARV